MFESETVGKVADATKAVADLGNTAIVAASNLGSVIRGPVDDILAILSDRLRFVKWRGRLTLGDKAAAIMKKRGLQEPTRDLPINFAVPLLTTAIVEEDDELQETWARLLVNAGDASTEMELRTAYVEILRGMSGFDVRNLSKLAQAQLSAPTGQFGFISAVDLPHSANWFRSGSADTIPDEVALSLGNLSRIGCVVPAAGWGGGINFAMVLVTELGVAMYRACS